MINLNLNSRMIFDLPIIDKQSPAYQLGCLRISNDSITHIIDHLKPTLEKLDLANIDIDYQKMFELKLMPKLKSLDCLCYRSEILHQLREQLPDVSVNGYPPMATICKKKKVKYDDYFDNYI